MFVWEPLWRVKVIRKDNIEINIKETGSECEGCMKLVLFHVLMWISAIENFGTVAKDFVSSNLIGF
jgi:hypothetical protein